MMGLLAAAWQFDALPHAVWPAVIQLFSPPPPVPKQPPLKPAHGERRV